MAGVIGLRGPDIEKRNALRGYKVEWEDADRPIIRPHTGAPVLRLEQGKPKVERHVFGFSRQFTSFNARADKLESSKMWARFFGKSHGIAPVSYILEWADLGEGKRPYRIERADGAAMCVPALVGHYFEDKATRAFALITVEPNAFVGRIHNRVIAQLADDQLDAWLRPEGKRPEDLHGLLGPGANEEFVAYPLKADVGSARFNDASALQEVGEPVTWTSLQAQGKGAAAKEPARHGQAKLAVGDEE